MVALLKKTCAIFWLVWMCFLSVLFGALKYQHKNSFVIDAEPSVYYTFIACISTVVISFIGCCCIKCDITHICCAIIYIVLTAVLLTGFCLFTLAKLEYTNGFDLSSYELLRQITKSFHSPAHSLPGYLERAERNKVCCGIFGFKDYRAFIFPPGFKQDVSNSCCRNKRGYKKKICLAVDDFEDEDTTPTTLFDIFNSTTTGNYTAPIRADKLKNKELKAILAALYGNYMRSWTTNQSLWLPGNPEKVENIQVKGCYKHLTDASQRLRETYTITCIIIIFSAFLMTIVYVQNCLKYRHEHQWSFLKSQHDMQRTPKKSGERRK